MATYIKRFEKEMDVDENKARRKLSSLMCMP